MTERNHPPEPVSDLEQEGIPEMEGAFPGEAATGLTWDGLVAPGDEPKGVEEFGITAAEERTDEPMSLRVLRETPDGAGVGESAVDDVAAARRLVEAQEGALDDEGDLVANMAAYDTGGHSAEEAAVHVIDEDEAVGVNWDASPDYVDDEAPGGGAGESPTG
ncbi:MAG: DUF5709 domain-containing protein [Actinomycetota bacterium]|nr:DUF5709 domain-containing protein [Actinomycetota bacterium]